MKMKMKMKILAVCVFILGFNDVFAAGSSVGKVGVVAVNAFGQVLVKAGDRGGEAPSCSVNFDRFVADLNTEHGKAMFSIILAAQAQGLNIRIGGTNQCDVRSDAETIQFVNLVL